MASIFTFDPDPPRVSSPWSTPPPGSKPRHAIPQDSKSAPSLFDAPAIQHDSGGQVLSVEDYSSITRLEAEPQEGPTEYKLHLLLRRRRSFLRTTTGRSVSGSMRRADVSVHSSVSRSVSESVLLGTTPPPSQSIQSRQNRLEELTTQLLWRLQQSCPNHIPSSTALVLPHLPEEAQLSAPAAPQRILPGLEESKGALYEIGVADDGTLVGLTEDEMEESLTNLRAMAASLGCLVQVQLRVCVGQCEWVEDARVMNGKLWVVEALVLPNQHLADQERPKDTQNTSSTLQGPALNISPPECVANDQQQRDTQQLRVSLTGATMSGKSSLLGSLSTATLDNGRGKSRLSLLKHRHEIASGMTSSVTQELIGYRDVISANDVPDFTQVINYSGGDVSSWVDIHASAEAGDNGRLVFLSDSAGHPRFRRTTVRGLVGWDPHWTLLCIPADNAEDSAGRIGASPAPQEILGAAAADLDLAHTHLQLCLNLSLPLVVVITKYDLATRPGLRLTLSKILSALKEAGRRPCIMKDVSSPASEAELNTIPSEELLEAGDMVQTLESSPLSAVPIIFTSAVNGKGITKLHAFLRMLPIPTVLPPPPGCPRTLFHIEDFYNNVGVQGRQGRYASDGPAVIGGHLRYGSLNIGDELVLGPYPVDAGSDDSDSGSGRPSSRNSPVPISRSFPGASRSGNSPRRRGSGYFHLTYDWRRVSIVSLRNLRLPVRTLHAGQVGTIGIVPVDAPLDSRSLSRTRKGMVLAKGNPQASKVVSVRFTDANAAAANSLTVGSDVVLYFASIRITSRVISVAPEHVAKKAAGSNDDDDDDAFGFGFDADSDGDEVDASPTTSATTVTFQFIATREFVEVDAKVLVLPGGGPGLSGSTERGEKGVAGFDGYVGRVVEAHG
ncbi:hypothetical protein BS50DRAFT_121445 [Corynespora cassiicola Philippines]|uniref:Tr-type G domain-containing protein n=1 Tax=Corynespora cassiicola Philippines TaxID=1448308 RepID=A0A2T2NAV8_CORCC|nr:hypothetical protein BS50DRAFT_121445 [Corynespora cassiicola Philippines]